MNNQIHVPKTCRLQQYYNRNQMSCTFAYEFQGKLDCQILKEAVQSIYKNDPIFSCNMPDHHGCPSTFQFERNSEEYQKKLDSVEKVVVMEVKELKPELDYLHNYSWDNLLFDGNKFAPVRVFVLKGYKVNEFTLVFTFLHTYQDGTNMNSFITFTLELYSILFKKQRKQRKKNKIKQRKLEALLRSRTALCEDEMVELHKPKFWPTFINLIRLLKVKYGDPGRFQLDFAEVNKIFQEKYLVDKKENTVADKGYTLMETFDFSQIFKDIRKDHPDVSKNSMLHAFFNVFLNHYNVNERYKKLGVKSEELQGQLTCSYSIKHLSDQQFREHSGNYGGLGFQTHDSRKLTTVGANAQEMHDRVQTLKKDNFGLTSQLMLGPFYNNEASITAVLNAGNKTSYMATSWTNFKLQQNPRMLKGAEVINLSSALQGGATPGAPHFPNALISVPIVIFNVGPKDLVAITYTYVDVETNVDLWKHFKIFYKEYVGKIKKQQLQQSSGEN